MSGTREPQTRSIEINVAPVLRRAGVRHPLSRVVELGELRVGDARIDAGRPIDVDLTLEATGNAVVAQGTLRTRIDCHCRRCLEPFDAPLETDVREIFEPRAVEGETYPLHAERIDLVPLLRDALLLALPLAPLCGDECAGPAPEQFPAHRAVPPSVHGASPCAGSPTSAVADGTPAEATSPAEDDAPRDPRWAVLDQLDLDR